MTKKHKKFNRLNNKKIMIQSNYKALRQMFLAFKINEMIYDEL